MRPFIHVYDDAKFKMEARIGFEPMYEVLQTPAWPLGYRAL